MSLSIMWSRQSSRISEYRVIQVFSGVSHLTRGKESYEVLVMILFLNACVRNDKSRTLKLAKTVLRKMSGEIRERKLEDIKFPIVDQTFLDWRDQCIAVGDYSSPAFDLAREFAEAEAVVIAAPFWDLSFPASLKQYFEQINVLGVTFNYTEEGVPLGLCNAKQLIYVTTAGGVIFSEEYGYGYIKALAQSFYGIPDVRMIKAEGLDILGADVDQILIDAENNL